MVDDYVFVIVIIIVILVVVVNAGVVVLPRSRRMLDSAAPAKERSKRVADRLCRHSRPPCVGWNERVADLTADVRVGQIERDVDERVHVLDSGLISRVVVDELTQ